MRQASGVALGILLGHNAFSDSYQERRNEKMSHATFKAGDLTAVIGNNEQHEEHRAGYNGIWSLQHSSCSRSLFVPTVAGLNHEHIFNGEADDSSQEVFFEPRYAPMTFNRISDSEAELHQPPTPTFHLESWTHFKLVEPHYIDMAYRCVAHRPVFPHGYIGLFWASYIDAPEDKSMYFLGGEGEHPFWMQLCTQRHNDESTALHRDDKTELTFGPKCRDALYRNLSPLRYQLPFYHGLFEGHLWMVMFNRTGGIRLTHSPSGGGTNTKRQTTNPAWDFQYIISNYEVGKEYGFKARAIFRPR